VRLARSLPPLKQGVERPLGLVACVVLHVLDHLAIGRLSHLKEPGTPLWGEPMWGKEEGGTGGLGSYRT
jgi:hypothetical protein